MNRYNCFKNLMILVMVLWAVSCSSTKSSLPISSQPGQTQTPLPKVSASIDQRFLGTWLVEGSSTEFSILRQKKQITIKGFDYTDNEAFNVRNTSWNSNSITTTITMPSTGHALNLKLTIVDENQLLCTFSGRATGTTNWIRKQ